MQPLLLAPLIYLLAHFLIYAAVLRRRPVCQTESGIFGWHVGSFILLGIGLIVGAALSPGPAAWATVVFGIGLHGIYSLSFLELWSLTQGSYSINILLELHRRGGRVRTGDLTAARRLGNEKQTARSGDLRRLGLIGPAGNPTPRGRAAAGVLRLLLWLSNGKPTN